MKVGPVVLLKFVLSTSLPVAMTNLIDPREPLNKSPWGFDELLGSLVETGEVRA